jgi:tetrahydromethanopterin S-methyltransferase subunit F
MNETQSQLETKPSIYAVAIKYGLLTGLLYVVFATVNYITESYGNFFLALLISIVISVTGIVLALREFKKQNAGFMTYGQGLGLGLMVSIIAGLISGVFSMLYIQFVDPGMPEKIVDATMEQMAAFGVDESMLEDKREEIMASFTPVRQLMSALSNAFFSGLILSLIIAAIMKHTRPEFE